MGGGKKPGIVDRFCSQQRVWEEGQCDSQGRPKILHPNNRLDSEVHTDLGNIIGPKQFTLVPPRRRDCRRQQGAVRISLLGRSDTRFSVESYTVGLRELHATDAKTHLEQHVVPGVLMKDEYGNFSSSKKASRPTSVLQCCIPGPLRERLPHITRVLTVPLPFRGENHLVYPKIGYDSQFGTYLVAGAPAITPMSLKEALRVVNQVHSEFCFTGEQSRIHAIARFLTPFGRAILGWTTRVPLWFYFGNRPRTGKDYAQASHTSHTRARLLRICPLARNQRKPPNV